VILLFWMLMNVEARCQDHAAFLAWADAPVSQTDPAPRALHPLDEAPANPAAAQAAEPGYRFVQQMYSEIADLVRERPGRIVPERFGTSLQGRPLWAFHVQEPGIHVQRRVLVFGGIHAMEWISCDVAIDLLHRLARGWLPAGTQVTVIPLLNPDGRAKVERDLADGREVYRRGNGRNVDLNRDFAVNRQPRAFWRRLIPGYYQTSPGPLSQPETQALDALAERERYQRAASLHAFGGFFYHPWSGRFGHLPQPDRREFMELGRAMESAQGTRAYRTRQLGRWGFFFRAHGSEIDHLYGRYGTRAFLIEITRSGIRPFRPSTWEWGFRAYNPEVPRRMERHRAWTVDSLIALMHHPETESEATARRQSTALASGTAGDEAP
jgi:hypothetical protein